MCMCKHNNNSLFWKFSSFMEMVMSLYEKEIVLWTNRNGYDYQAKKTFQSNKEKFLAKKNILGMGNNV
jgi:hypothetical protein